MALFTTTVPFFAFEDDWNRHPMFRQQQQHPFLAMRRMPAGGCGGFARDPFFTSRDVDTSNNKDFSAVVDLRGFSPEEVEVSMEGDNVLTVSAKSEKEKNGSKVFKEVRRSFTVPEGCDVAAMTAKVRQDGKMEIAAPVVKKQQQAVEEQKKEKEEAVDAKQQQQVTVDVRQKQQQEQQQQEKAEVRQEQQQQKVAVQVHRDKADKQKVEVQVHNKEGTKSKAAQEITKAVKAAHKSKEAIEIAAAAATATPTPFWTEVDVTGFGPEDLKVEATDSGRVRVSGRREERDEASGAASVKSFAKEFLVDGATFDLKTLRSSYSAEKGILAVEAQPAKKQEDEKKDVVSIPVNVL